MICFFSSNQWNVQYVGNTTLPLNKGIKLHRRAILGSEFVIKHFKDICAGASYSVKIIQVFPNSGYKKNKVCPVNHTTRLNRKDNWIETLRTFHHYGLKKGKRKLTHIYQLDVHFPLFQGQDKDPPDVEIMSILKSLNIWNPYLPVFITTLKLILKSHSTKYEYFRTTLERNIFKRSLLKFYKMAYSIETIQLNLNTVGSYLAPLNKLNKRKKYLNILAQ